MEKVGLALNWGPIVAFFLWLTLAVIQGSSNPFPGLYTPASATEQANLNPTISQMGDPQNITTMMVAIIMLLMGLNTAVSVSKDASPKLGQIAASIKSSGGPVTAAARYSYRGARAVGGAAAIAGSSQISLSGQASSALFGGWKPALEERWNYRSDRGCWDDGAAAPLAKIGSRGSCSHFEGAARTFQVLQSRGSHAVA